MLSPPDKKQCQAEIKEGSFMTLGPRSWYRCTNKPVVIVTEAKAGPDGKKGSMSLCKSCRDMMIKKLGRKYFTEEKIKAA